MRTAAALALVVVLAFAGSTAAQAKVHVPTGYHNAAKACKAERKADPAAFKTKYANKKGKAAFGRCVSQHVRAAVKSCRAERKADLAAFKTKYGNKNSKRALVRCVRAHSGDALPAPTA